LFQKKKKKKNQIVQIFVFVQAVQANRFLCFPSHIHRHFKNRVVLLPRRLVVTLRSNVSLFYFDASPSVSSLAEFSGVPHQGRTTFILRAVAFIILLSIFIYLFIFYQSTPPHFFILKQLKRLQMYLGFFFSNHSNSSKRKPVNVRVTKKKKKSNYRPIFAARHHRYHPLSISL
jgi:hypothetical protein